MKRPNILALPTSQMMAYCDVLGLGDKVQESTESMIVALEAADFSKLEVGVSHGFEPDDLGEELVANRKARLGRK
jgi:hypothetical protein